MTWLCTFTPRPFTNLTISLAFSSEMPRFTLMLILEVPLAASWIGPSASALRETLRLTSLSFNTSSAAFSRSSVAERISRSVSSCSIAVPVFLKSNRVATSRLAWSTALATSGIETSDTTSKEKTSFAKSPHPFQPQGAWEMPVRIVVRKRLRQFVRGLVVQVARAQQNSKAVVEGEEGLHDRGFGPELMSGEYPLFGIRGWVRERDVVDVDPDACPQARNDLQVEVHHVA